MVWYKSIKEIHSGENCIVENVLLFLWKSIFGNIKRVIEYVASSLKWKIYFILMFCIPETVLTMNFLKIFSAGERKVFLKFQWVQYFISSSYIINYFQVTLIKPLYRKNIFCRNFASKDCSIFCITTTFNEKNTFVSWYDGKI